MLIKTARDLDEGDKIQEVHDRNELTFLSGPYQNANQAVWFVVARDNVDGIVRLYNLNQVVAFIPDPKAGEVWYDHLGPVNIVEVSPQFIIHVVEGEGDLEQAQVTLKNHFLRRFTKRG
jgi:hypothetical protein